MKKKTRNNIAIIIPIRLSSKRFKNKILKKILGYSIFEHVFLRSKNTGLIKERDILVATSDKILLKKNNFKKINFFLTKLKHRSGSSRAGEVAKKIKRNLYIIIFGDEPLITPEDVKIFINKVKLDNKYDFFNAVCNVKKNELSKANVVKCEVNKANEIVEFKRIKSKNNKKRIYKSVGIFAFRRELLLNFRKMSNINNSDIEQNSLLMNLIKIKAIKISYIPCSVNTKEELSLVKKFFLQKKQKKIINEYLF